MNLYICLFKNFFRRKNKHDLVYDLLFKKIYENFQILLNKNDIIYNEYNKPLLKKYNVFFNISYSDNIAVLAISKNKVGIDIEKIKSYNEDIVNRIYSISEKKLLENSKNKDYLFTKLWTYKEAYVKYLETGIDKNFINLNFVYNNELSCNSMIHSIDYNNYIITYFCKNPMLDVEVLTYE